MNIGKYMYIIHSKLFVGTVVHDRKRQRAWCTTRTKKKKMNAKNVSTFTAYKMELL